MGHPLEQVMREAKNFVLIGDSSEDRFPAMSYHSYTQSGQSFYCIDLGGLTESRGGTKGGRVYTAVSELPEDRGDLAIIWVKPSSSARAVDVAHEAGCTKVWFSFGTGHPDGVARAREHGMQVVEVGRCPVYYADAKVGVCKAHTAMVKLSGLYRKPPRTEGGKHRGIM